MQQVISNEMEMPSGWGERSPQLTQIYIYIYNQGDPVTAAGIVKPLLQLVSRNNICIVVAEKGMT